MTKEDKKIIVLNEVESTNNYASQLILSDAAEEGTIVLTQFQTSGRGQAGNRWESEAGKNLLASLILYPGFLNAAKQFAISKVVSLGLAGFLESEIEGVSIKWPNDIYVGDKKIAGILIENTVKGNSLASSVVGVGLNLNQERFFSDAPNPVSLKQITGKDYDVEKVVPEILGTIFSWYEKLKMGSFSEIDSAYFSKLYGVGEWRKFIKNDIIFNARIIGIGKFGQLRLEEHDGTVKEFMFKEVEFVV
jgi:BirA family biotin operon repressor/biotin-[acetyl-CoA-carboxylase] ligase